MPTVQLVRDPYRRRAALALLVPSLLILLVSWPWFDVEPHSMLDPSWQGGLALAWRDGLAFGEQVVFTYGPLGFLKHLHLYFTDTYRLALAYQLVLHALFSVVLYWSARRAFGPWIGFFVALVAACFLIDDAMLALVALLALAVTADRGIDAGRWFAPAAGALVGFELLGKLSVGLVGFAVLLVAVASQDRDRGRGVLAYLGAAAVTFLAGWLVAGQPLDALGGYAVHGYEIVSGYTAAMSASFPNTLWQYWGALVVAIVVLYGGWVSTEEVSARRRGGTLLILAIVLFTTFKEGFARHDPGHAAIFFGTLLVVAVALPWRRGERAVPVLVAALIAGLLCGAATWDPIDLVRPVSRPADLASQVALAVDGGHRDRDVRESRALLQAEYALEPAVLDELRGHAVDVQPWETNVVWAYQLGWRPLPVFQETLAYTTALDDLNARALRSPDGPDRVLREAAQTLDGRFPATDVPRQYLALLCSFRAVVGSPRWYVLARVPDRCGDSRPLTTVHTGWGRPVAVPAAGPGELVIADVDGVGVSGLERIQALAWRPEHRYLTVDGTATVRLVPATAGDGLVVSVPAAADFPAPIRVGLDAHRIAFAKGEDPRQSGGDITVRFRAVPIAGPGTAAP
jgi:hypothetical protein